MVLNFHCNKWIRGGDPTKVSGGLFYKKKTKQKKRRFCFECIYLEKKKMVWSDKPQAAAESRSDVLYMIFNEAFFQPAHRLTFDNTSLCAEPLRVQLYTRASVQRLKLTSGCQLMCNYIMNCNGIHIFFCLPRVAFKCVHNASCLCVCVCSV